MIALIETLPIPQLTAAWLLARAFSHEWAQGHPDTMSWPGPLTLRGIAKATMIAAGDCPFSGIQAPNLIAGDEWPGIGFGNSGDLAHVTASRRLAWAVAPDGSVTIEIRRPNPDGLPVPVLGAITSGAARYQSAACVRIGEDYHHRHLVALHEALLPLCGLGPTLVAMAPLWVWAKADA